MIPYATRTGTLLNLDRMRQGGWGILLNPFGDLSPLPDGFDEVGLDNGAWTADQKGLPFNVPVFERALDRVGASVKWLTAPDIVCGGLASLALSVSWLERLRAINDTVLIVLQDGMEPEHLRPYLEQGFGLFLGGSTEWKEAQMIRWGQVAAHYGSYYHIGRVNTGRRMALVNASGANSCDGTSASQFAKTIPMLTNTASQPDLFSPR